ncbi:MAG: hypothetical protein V4492_02375 [Chlamydiota bacterium]
MDSDGKAKSLRRNARRAARADEDRRRSSGPSSCESGERIANRTRRACFTRPFGEHAIWQSQMSLKGARGGSELIAACRNASQ